MIKLKYNLFFDDMQDKGLHKNIKLLYGTNWPIYCLGNKIMRGYFFFTWDTGIFQFPHHTASTSTKHCLWTGSSFHSSQGWQDILQCIFNVLYFITCLKIVQFCKVWYGLIYGSSKIQRIQFCSPSRCLGGYSGINFIEDGTSWGRNLDIVSFFHHYLLYRGRNLWHF